MMPPNLVLDGICRIMYYKEKETVCTSLLSIYKGKIENEEDEEGSTYPIYIYERSKLTGNNYLMK